ncbi:MAG: membrane protein insertion efficiency factor YidD [Ignavibacteriales bacterium]|nr:MAG: membrane protein insertion efficiency factor YidD [Ignavibacteriales bacterium]
MKFVFAFIALLAATCLCQEDYARWQAKELSYQIKNEEIHDLQSSNKDLEDVLITAARSVYKIFISDVDGDNCPFEPTCSAFFIESVRQTNLIQGSLMFADRFTRDLNFLKVLNHYPVTKRARFFDPTENYKLEQADVNPDSFKEKTDE